VVSGDGGEAALAAAEEVSEGLVGGEAAEEERGAVSDKEGISWKSGINPGFGHSA